MAHQVKRSSGDSPRPSLQGGEITLRQSPVQERVNELRQAVEKLHALFDELEERLGPVMVPQDATDGPEPLLEFQAGSELGQAIETAHMSLGAVAGRIGRILRGLEI